MKINFETVTLEVVPDKNHEWLLDTAAVAEGYGVTDAAIRNQKLRHADELKEGKHWVVTICDTLGGKQESISWTKKGVVRLGFFIRSAKAAQFRDWAEDLIVSVTEKVSPVDDLAHLQPHTQRETQIQNSKDVNRYLFTNWDVDTLAEYNRRNCLMVSGKTPTQLKEHAKKRGLKARQRTSGKEVLRHLRPALAAQMSVNDTLVQRGVSLVEANSLSAPCLPLLEKMISLNLLTAAL